MQPRKPLHGQCIGVHRPYDIRSLRSCTACSVHSLTNSPLKTHTHTPLGWGGGGGGHCLPCYHSPLSLSLLVHSPLFLKHQRTIYYYYCCYLVYSQQASLFSYPDTMSPKTVTKTLIIANLGCFPWPRQAKNYCPHRVGPSNSPLLRVLGTAPIFPT